MGFKDIIIGVVIIGVFLLAMINFAVFVSINNGGGSILNDPALSNVNNSLYSELNDIQQTAQTQREVFEQQEAQGGSSDEGFSLTAIVGISKTFLSVAVSSINLIFTVFTDVLGIPPIVLNVILGAIILTTLILIWSVIKAGRT